MRNQGRMSVFFVVVLLAAGAIDPCVIGETKHEKTAESVPRTLPFTEPPAAPEWRLGYRLAGGGTFLGARTITEAHIRHGLMLLREHDCLELGQVLIPQVAESTAIATDGFVNPPRWTVVGVDGSSAHLAFPFLAVTSGYEMGGNGELWLASEDLEPRCGECFPAIVEDSGRLVVAVAGIDHEPVVRLPPRKIPSPPPSHLELLRHETVRSQVERDYRTIRAAEINPRLPPMEMLSEPPTEVRASRIEAMIDGRLETLWFLYYQWGEEIESAWLLQLLARETGSNLQLLAEPRLSCRVCGLVQELDRVWNFFWADFLAAVDIDGDRTDELLLEVQYYEGGGIWIVEIQDGRLAWARPVPERE